MAIGEPAVKLEWPRGAPFEAGEKSTTYSVQSVSRSATMIARKRAISCSFCSFALCGMALKLRLSVRGGVS
jgi:hypothetical protein